MARTQSPSFAAAILKQIATFLLLALPFGQPAHGETMSDPRMLPKASVSDAEAEREGYRRLEVDLGSTALNFSAHLREDVDVNRFGSPDDLETPGRNVLATLYDPSERDAFSIRVEAISPGFAAEAFLAAEQMLFENGYGLVESRFESPLFGDSFGIKRQNGQVVSAARSLCANRGPLVVCFLIQFDAGSQQEAMDQAAFFAGSLVFEDAQENSFGEGDVVDENLILQDGKTLFLKRPSAWTVAENDFRMGEPGYLLMHLGADDDPVAVLSLSAQTGTWPGTEDQTMAEARVIVNRYAEANDHLFGDARLIEGGFLSGSDERRHYASVFVLNSRVDRGQFQMRLNLIDDGTIRYAILMTTNYSPGTTESGPFFARWAGTTAQDLAVRSVLGHHP